MDQRMDRLHPDGAPLDHDSSLTLIPEPLFASLQELEDACASAVQRPSRCSESMWE